MEIGSLCLEALKPIMSVRGISQEGPSLTSDGISTFFLYQSVDWLWGARSVGYPRFVKKFATNAPYICERTINGQSLNFTIIS